MPTTSPVGGQGRRVRRRARSRSPSASPAARPRRSSRTITFWGLTSRWTTPRSWACASASQRSAAISATSRSQSIAVGSQLGERLAGDQLGDQDRAAVALAELVEGDDRRVVEAGGGLRLAQDPVGVRARAISFSATWRCEPLVEGPVDGPHAPGADPLDHPEAAPSPALPPRPSSVRRSRGALLPRAAPGLAPRQGSYSGPPKATSAQPWLSSTRTNYNRPDPARAPGRRGPERQRQLHDCAA